MRRLTFLLVASVLPLGAAGCNWSDLDAEFLAGVPQRGDLKVTPPSQQKKQALSADGDLGSQQSAIKSAAAQSLDDNANNLNGLIESLTAGLDAVRQITPSVRETDRRVWGPYPDDKEHSGCDIQVELKRTVLGFEYSVQWRDRSPQGDFVPVLRGTFAGDQASHGSGGFVLDATASRSLTCFTPCDPAATDGCDQTLTLDYIHSPDLEVRVHRVTTKVDASYRHARAADGNYEMNYSYQKVENRLTVLVQADAKWLGNRAGYLKVLLTLPAWPTVARHYRECWDQTLEQVYWSKDYVDLGTEPICTVLGNNGLCEMPGGDPTNCTPPLP